MTDEKFEPNEYASPACYAHELMPEFKDDVIGKHPPVAKVNELKRTAPKNSAQKNLIQND